MLFKFLPYQVWKVYSSDGTDSNLTLFSYDGSVFHNQADSKNGHYYTTLAKIDGAPLSVGGDYSQANKAEILDVSSNLWTEVAEYPYHDK